VTADRVAAEQAVADAHRREWAFVLAATARVAGDLDVAEECVQDAYLAALDAWTRDGVPTKPGAWLTATARRKALDILRRDKLFRTKMPMLVEPDEAPPAEPDEDEDAVPDDRLRLVFTCCHPALARDAQVALTLRLVCGVSTEDIATVFLVSESTMAARVTRAKKKIAAARIPYRVPDAAELPERLDAVLSVVHLMFTTGHTAPTGADLVRAQVLDRSVHLARVLLTLMPDEPEVRGLLALLLLTDARRAARVDAAGEMVLMEQQDRATWDRDAIAEGSALVERALRRSAGSPGPYLLQAAIAAAHSTAPTFAATDWTDIVALYDRLVVLVPTDIVRLNRAVAVAHRDGPAAGLALVDRVEGLDRYHLLHSSRAELLRRLGRLDEADAAYGAALACAPSASERRFLERRRDALHAAG
jgi:RNA polymerase sigma-70 factor (ECF subfamily)